MADINPTLLLVSNKDIERFMKYVSIPHDPTDCWEWQGPKNRQGYGKFGYQIGKAKQRTIGSHRWLLLMINGLTESLLLACHHCDNPACVNPAHLYFGTHGDNNRDTVQRGRCKSGDEHWTRKYPEKLKRGDETWAHRNPQLACKGLLKWKAQNPDFLRGDNNPNRKYPERTARGERQHLAKLTSALVLEIRHLHEALHIGAHRLAKQFGVSKACIQAVLNRKTWKHV